MNAIPLSKTAAKRRIGDILLDHGFVTAEEIAEATLEQERTQQPLGQILVGRGSITRLELASALAEQWSDPAASITATARSAPAPVPAPSAQDEAEYAARLQEAVADLARKVQSNRPLEGIDERVDELSRRIEGTLARTQHIEAAVATLAESLEGVTTGVEEAFRALQIGTAELVNDLARIEQTVAEIATREAPHGEGPSLADLEELRAAVSELSGGTEGTADLREQVDGIAAQLEELRARTGVDELQSTVDGRLERLEALLEASTAGEAQLTTRVDALAERLSDTPTADPRVDDALAQIERLDALLERTTSEVGDVAAAVGRRDEAEVDGRIDDLVQTLEVLRGEIAEVGASVRPDEASAERLGAVETQLEGLSRAEFVTSGALEEALSRRDDAALASRLDALEARLADGVVTPDALTRSIEWAMSERDAPATDERVTGLAADVETLRVDMAALAHEDERPDHTDRLAELEAEIDRVSQEANDDGHLLRRLDELETARRGDLETINVLAVAMDRIRHDLTTAPTDTEADTSPALEMIAALAERLSALESFPAREPVTPRDDSELVSELERFRLVLERIGLHLGEHDRAIADLAPNRDVQERLQELTVLVHDLAESGQTAPAPHPGGSGAPITGDAGSLLQRLEEAESASQTDNEKLMNRLERMASSIDWRLQRLEADESETE